MCAAEEGAAGQPPQERTCAWAGRASWGNYSGWEGRLPSVAAAAPATAGRTGGSARRMRDLPDSLRTNTGTESLIAMEASEAGMRAKPAIPFGRRQPVGKLRGPGRAAHLPLVRLKRAEVERQRNRSDDDRNRGHGIPVEGPGAGRRWQEGGRHHAFRHAPCARRRRNTGASGSECRQKPHSLKSGSGL